MLFHPRAVRRTLTAGAALAAGLTTMGTAHAQITKSGDGYLIRMKFVKGTTAAYTMNSNITVSNGTTMKLSIPFSTKVLDVKGDVGTLLYSVGPTSLNGMVQGKAQTSEVKMDSHGKANGKQLAQMKGVSIQLPEKPLKIGETYSRTMTIPVGQMTVNSTATYKFLGLKTVAGKQAAQFSMKAHGTGAITADATGVTNLAVSDGSLIDTNVTQTFTVKQGAEVITMKGTTIVSRK
jgi:hypothetical protein